MLSDPITIAANAPTPALDFAVIRSDGYGTERRDAGGVYAAVINHTPGKNGDRHYLQIKQTVDAVNPYSGLTSPQSATVSIAVSKPGFGFDDTALAALIQLALDTLAAATPEAFLAFQS